MASLKMMAKPRSTVTPLQLLLLVKDGITEREIARACGLSPTKLSKAKYNARAFTEEESARVRKFFGLPRRFNFDLLVDKRCVKHLLSTHFAK